MNDDELLEALGVKVETKAVGAHTPREERVIAGFEDIVNFYKEHGRAPRHGEEGDIFERLYAVRLDRLRDQPEFFPLLAPFDEYGLLSGEVEDRASDPEDDDALLAELGVDIAAPDGLTVLKHVKPRAEIQAAEEVATRTPCKDFAQFKPLFDRVQKDLDSGVRTTRRFQREAEIKLGDFFILGGQKAYVAEMGEEFFTDQNRRNAHLRVIFDNRTESGGLLRLFQRALYKDEVGRRITEPEAGPLFAQAELPDGEDSGTIYVLRSKMTRSADRAEPGSAAQDRRERGQGCEYAHRQRRARRHFPARRSRGRSDLQASEHQPDEARKPPPQVLLGGEILRSRNQGSFWQSSEAPRMVHGPAARHRRGR